MKCRDARQMLNSYFDNKTDPMKDRLLAEHIKSCPECRAEYEFLTGYRTLLKTVKPLSPPDNFLSEIRRKIELQKSRSISGRIVVFLQLLRQRTSFPMEAAGVLAAATVVFFLYKPFYTSKSPAPFSESEIISPAAESSVKHDKTDTAVKIEKKPIIKDLPVERADYPSSESAAGKREVKLYEESKDEASAGEKTIDQDSMAGERPRETYSPSEEKSVQSLGSDIFSSEKEDRKKQSAAKKTISLDDADINAIFYQYGAAVIKKDISDRSRLIYLIKLTEENHPRLIKRLKTDFFIEEKIIRKTENNIEIELFIKRY